VSSVNVEQAADRAQQMQELAAYIEGKVLKGKNAALTADTPLVSSSLVDSFAMVEIFLELQKITGLKIPASKVQAKDMDTIRLMFGLAEKFGKPVKK
jgi:acyl carrier protein